MRSRECGVPGVDRDSLYGVGPHGGVDGNLDAVAVLQEDGGTARPSAQSRQPVS